MNSHITKPRLAAFGASNVSPDAESYKDVQNLSKSIARAGWNGITGGHQGMMAAFSEGIHQGGGHIRGVTLERFPTPPGNSFSEEIRADDFFERLSYMIENSDAWLVLPGGLGTLAELAMVWDLLAIRVLKARPLLLYGQMWPPLIAVLKEQLIVSTNQAYSTIQICQTHTDVLQALATSK
ncbi:MAG: LOG family protein [Mariprofundus sp.]|nr:LOG family protein [Mariprofundus sp.]